MAYYFFDSSALVKYYVGETGTQWVQGLIDAQSQGVLANEISIAHVTGAEIVAAISRRAKIGLTSASDSAKAIGVFNTHFQTKYRVLLVSLETVEGAMSLAEKHTLRGYDAIQLAAVLLLEEEMTISGIGPLILISADIELNQAAQAEGLLTDDPNQHP
ncbi:MAG: type II toxin-antitoxin system VapC family toxin [Acidobacteriota bacterium]|nr:type II toxin-antitoxin system VapC family toxin [Acidobacteriota bacterium]